jgi:hypothetical protein
VERLDKSRPRAYSAPVAGFRDKRALWNGLGAALAAPLAVLAIVLQVLVPQGFMPGQAPGGPALVICTGHGPLLRASDLSGSGRKAPGHHDACAFAGHGTAPSLAVGPQVPPVRLAYAAPPPATGASQAAARALAAPPPPATGPPGLA